MKIKTLSDYKLKEVITFMKNDLQDKFPPFP